MAETGLYNGWPLHLALDAGAPVTESTEKGTSCVNRSELIEAIAARLEGDRKSATTAVEGVLDEITRALVRGERVSLTGFGTFDKRVRAARTARNPATGESIRLKKTSVPGFKAGATLKAYVSGATKLAKAAPAKKTTKAAAAAKATSPTKKTAAKKTTAAARKTAPAKKVTAAKKASPAKKVTAAKKASPAKKATARKTAAKKTAR